MPDCRNCGAPLPVGQLVCGYCHTRQDVNLRGIHEYTVTTPESERTCPRCDIPLTTVDLDVGEVFLIERCSACHGLFFDPNELQALLDRTVDNVFDVDYQALNELSRVRRHDEYGVRYVRCPVCGAFMNRLNFGSKSGVIVDTCREHGIWLDGGELRELLEWAKAGGLIYDQKRRLEKERQELQAERERRRGALPVMGDVEDNRVFRYRDDGDEVGELIIRFARFLIS